MESKSHNQSIDFIAELRNQKQLVSCSKDASISSALISKLNTSYENYPGSPVFAFLPDDSLVLGDFKF